MSKATLTGIMLTREQIDGLNEFLHNNPELILDNVTPDGGFEFVDTRPVGIINHDGSIRDNLRQFVDPLPLVSRQRGKILFTQKIKMMWKRNKLKKENEKLALTEKMYVSVIKLIIGMIEDGYVRLPYPVPELEQIDRCCSRLVGIVGRLIEENQDLKSEKKNSKPIPVAPIPVTCFDNGTDKLNVNIKNENVDRGTVDIIKELTEENMKWKTYHHYLYLLVTAFCKGDTKEPVILLGDIPLDAQELDIHDELKKLCDEARKYRDIKSKIENKNG
ncbi:MULTISPECIES: hypothetical protein [Butyricimonas]|uniref:hypothetical protein n=1 Tax=Butyricimonas TaxID=574697 RepID=UPI0007FB2838|nr:MULTISPECIES: hypothetical protein [Butyricimonas]